MRRNKPSVTSAVLRAPMSIRQSSPILRQQSMDASRHESATAAANQRTGAYPASSANDGSANTPAERVALFERFGGPEVGALARRRFLQPEVPLDQEARDAWRQLALPVYTRIPRDPEIARRAINRPEVALHWFGRPDGESDTFNMFPDLGRIQCPTLVLGGEDDPMHPIESQADIAEALPAHLVQFERFANCGHAVVPDAPERAMALLREFILRR